MWKVLKANGQSGHYLSGLDGYAVPEMFVWVHDVDTSGWIILLSIIVNETGCKGIVSKIQTLVENLLFWCSQSKGENRQGITNDKWGEQIF